MDRAPPYVANSSVPGVNYDGVKREFFGSVYISSAPRTLEMKLRSPLRRAVFWGAACLFAGHVSFCYGDTSSNVHCPKAISSAKDLLSLRSIGGYTGNVSVSPDGQLVAFQLQDPDFFPPIPTTSDGTQCAWTVMCQPYLGSGGDLMLQPAAFGRSSGSRAELVARWSPNSEVGCILTKTGGEVQVWRSRADGSLQEQVTHNAADVMGFAWTADGAAIYYTVGRGPATLCRVPTNGRVTVDIWLTIDLCHPIRRSP